MTNWLTKKLGKIIVGIIVFGFSLAFFIVKQYFASIITLLFLIILLKIEFLTKFVLNKSGIEAQFEIPEENIKKDIRDNNEPINKKTFTHFKEIEKRVLKEIHKRIGGKLKYGIHFVYGEPDRPQLTYTPDGIIQKEKELILIEIKYILHPEIVQKIVKNSICYLEKVLAKFKPSAGKELKVKLILASRYKINTKSFSIPEGIEIEFYKI